MIIFGCLLIFVGIKLFKAKSLKSLIIYLCVSFLISACSTVFIITSIISPIYKLSSSVLTSSQNKSVVPTPTPDPTVNWKTYQGEVTFQYPAKWIEEKKQTSDTSTDRVFVSPEESYSLSFSVSQNYNNLTKKPFSTLKDITANAPDLKEFATVNIDSQAAGRVKGYQSDNEGNGGWTYKMFTFSMDKKSIYTLYLFRSNKNIKEDKEGEQIFDQILSTFRFTDNQTIDTSTWKRYTNDNIDFSLNYPADWKIYSESMPRMEFVNDEGLQFRVCRGCSIIPASKYSNENEYFRLLQSEGYREEVIKDRKVMLLTQREAEGTGSKSPHLYVSHGYLFHNGLSYSFDLFTPSPKSENPEPLLIQILSTFNFTK